MTGVYVWTTVAGVLAAVILTPLVMRLARRFGIIDDPASAPDRKRHTRPIPLLGGAAVILATVGVWWVLAAFGYLQTDALPLKYVIGLSLAAGWLLIGGWLDDRYHLTPGQQFVWPVLAALSVVISGVGVDFITNPFGGLLYLDTWNLKLFSWHETPYFLTLPADLLSFLWLIGMMYTTKILDGLDGLVSGVGVVGSLVVFLLTLRPEVNQPGVAMLALAFGGACLGFLLFNWHPAKIFLGESGSLFIGFVLGVLSIISGGKIATALLIMGLPILDLAWVILQRRFGAHLSPWRTSDRRHLHFRLVDAGLSVRQAVLTLLGLTLLFGLSTLWVSGRVKLAVLVGVVLVLMALGILLSRLPNRSGEKRYE